MGVSYLIKFPLDKNEEMWYNKKGRNTGVLTSLNPKLRQIIWLTSWQATEKPEIIRIKWSEGWRTTEKSANIKKA